jgi:hypothetical protein
MSSCGAKNVWLTMRLEAWEQRDYAQRLFFCRCPSCHPHIPPYAFELVAPSPSSHRCANGLRESMAG